MNSYKKIRQDFSLPRHEFFNFATDVVDKWALEFPEKLAMLWVDDNGTERRISFSQMSQASKRAANCLANAGIQRGDTVIVMLGRQVAWWEIMTACLRMGVVVSPGTTQLSEKDITYRANATEASCIITDVENITKLKNIREQCSSVKEVFSVGGAYPDCANYDDLLASASDSFDNVVTVSDEDALCYFTSGTTGYPKMCIHNHIYALGHTTTGKYWLDLKSDDLHWNLSDTGWAKAAWSSYFAPWLQGTAIFVHDTVGFNPKASLEMFKRFDITTFCGAPTIYRMFVQQDLSEQNFNKLRHCVGAGEPLNPEVIEVWKKTTGITIYDGYGQTESIILCGNMTGVEPRFGSMGKPMPGIDLAVVNELGEIVAPGEEGDIAVNVNPVPPLGLFKGYKNQIEKTKACFRGDWYITGDRATVDEDGYFWFVSRSDDVILSSGYRIGPFEVESALLEHPAIAESAVVSSPDPDRGEVVKAFIVLVDSTQASELLLKELQQHVKTVTAPYKYPRKIEFVESLPKTVSGKIRRVELREQEWSDG